jgi:hypothetical protein
VLLSDERPIDGASRRTSSPGMPSYHGVGRYLYRE